MTKPPRVSAVVKRQVLILFTLTLTAYAGLAQNAAFSTYDGVTSGCSPLTVHFKDESTGSPDAWLWDLGNGNTSTEKDPDATYVSARGYTVKLTVFKNGAQIGTVTKTNYVVVHANPIANFSFNKSSGCSPLEVQFSDLSTSESGVITEWLWAFGDGAQSNIPNPPPHKYTTSGNKAVTLRVKSQYGCENVMVKASAINVQGPVALFTASNVKVCQVPATINFTNRSTGAVSYTWDFGNGETSTDETSHVTYDQPGSYTVVLKARDAQGCESSESVTVLTGSDDGLAFTPSATKVCVGEAVNFTIQADAPMLSIDWDFDNGTSSTEENAVVTYPAHGIYDVTLEAMLQGKSCHSVVTKKIEVLADPVPDFTYKADCNNNVTFTSTSTGSARLEWYIDNVLSSTGSSFLRAFGTSGKYTIKLIGYNALNCSKTLEREITIAGKPKAAFTPNQEQDCTSPSLSGCAPFPVQFKNESDGITAFTSQWNFGDGTSSNDKEPSHIYGKGNFTVTLRITNAQGCSSTASAKVAVADTKPVAKFTTDKTEVCTRENVRFTDQSQGANFWCWDFGDGNTGTGSQVTHSYVEPGVYTVTLIAKNAGCTDTFVITNAVKVNAPLTNFELKKNCFDPYNVSLQNLSADYHSLEWDFGDGTKSTTDVSGHRYSAVGDYTIKLTATNNTTHCTVTVLNGFTIRDVRADFTIDNVKPCKGAQVKFTDTSDDAVKWEWVFGDGTISSAQYPVMSYHMAGPFNPRLRVTDADGCTDEKALPLTVLDIQGNFMFNATSTCDKLTVDFDDYSTGNPQITDWHWDFGDGNTSTDPEPHHVYTALGSYPVTLTLTNADGNCSFIKYDAVKFTNPVPEFTTPKPAYCINDPIVITNWSRDAISFNWDFNDGRSANTIHTQISYPATGSYPVTLHATDGYGCKRSVTKTAFITITKPVAGFKAFDTEGTCPPLITAFQDLSTGNVASWQWDFGNDTYSVLKDPVNTYTRPGIFDVSLKVTDANGCSDTTMVEKLVRVGGPDGTFRSSMTAPSCVNTTVQFNAVTTNTVVHRWDYGDGNVEDMPMSDTDHLYTGAGSFNTSLVLIDDKGCKVVAVGNEKIVVGDTTKIDFKYNPVCIFEGDPFLLQAEAAEEVTWAWEMEGKALGTDAVQQVLLDTAGEHHVVLRATNQYGCVSTISHNIPVHGNITFIPNVFTPNNDAYNDRFEVRDLEKSRWDLRVYNRWGDPVYKKDDYLNEWDGGDLASGVYFFRLSNAVCEKTYKGHVTISR